jgi:hypothetical protein
LIRNEVKSAERSVTQFHSTEAVDTGIIVAAVKRECSAEIRYVLKFLVRPRRMPSTVGHFLAFTLLLAGQLSIYKYFYSLLEFSHFNFKS